MANIGTTVWGDILGHVRVRSPDVVRGWFAQLEPAKLEGGVLLIKAGNGAQTRYLRENCKRCFVEAAQAATGRLLSVAFESNAPEELSGGDAPLAFQAEYVEPTLNPDYSFSNFVTGPCNRLAHAAALAVSRSPGKAYNPFFIHGDVGLGKTHLLQAICHDVLGQTPVPRVSYITCETFANHFFEAVEHGVLNQFRYRYRHVDLLVIDDIQFLAERERSQEEFFHTFNTLHQMQKQIVLTADSSPSEIPSLEQRLVSRFNSGLVARMDPPCFETRVDIVRRKAKLRCIEIDEQAANLIAARVDSNIRELEGALFKIDALSQSNAGRIDIALVREALGERPTRTVTIQHILDAVTQRCGVRLADLQGKRRHKSVTRPRQICMYLARELTPLSLEEIGGYFGGRDHTTVLYASRMIGEQRENDEPLARLIDDLTAELRTIGRTGG